MPPITGSHGTEAGVQRITAGVTSEAGMGGLAKESRAATAAGALCRGAQQVSWCRGGPV